MKTAVARAAKCSSKSDANAEAEQPSESAEPSAGPSDPNTLTRMPLQS